MNRSLVIIIVGLAMVILSCSNEESKEKETSMPVKNSYGIVLIENQKWKVDQHMMVHIRKMESDIQLAKEETGLSYDDLAKKLDANIDSLTSNCTMKGQAHDELHKWLLPFIDLVSDLNEAQTKDEQASVFELIDDSMKEFNFYFQ